jgi:hypothetical protein
MAIPSDTLHINAYMDLCWPPSDQCQDRPLTDNEHNRAVLMGQNINTLDPRCAEIQAQTMMDIDNGMITMWTVGPPEYDPANYYGDRHNAVGLTHLTANAYRSNYELMRTLIHEAAHAVGVTDDGDATQLEETCLGDYSG